MFLGVEPRFTVLDALENIHRLDDTYFKGLITPTPAGVDLLAVGQPPACSAPSTCMRVKALFEFVTAAYPWVIIDCPRSDPAVLDALDVDHVGAGRGQPGTGHAAQRQPARRAAAPALRHPAACKLAINRFDTESEIGRKDVERVLGGTVAYTLPSDYRAAVAALNKGEPLINGQQGRLPMQFRRSGARSRRPAAAQRRTPCKPGSSAGSVAGDRTGAAPRSWPWQSRSVHAW